MDFDRDHDARVRTATFEWLARQVETHGEVVPRPVLAQGLRIDGRRVPLLGPQGIFKPAIMQAPLSITTSPNGPYDDGIGPDNLLRYRYRGTNPQHPDNAGLRFAMRHELPLVYCHGVVPGRYVVMWPAYVVHDFPDYLAFSVAVDDIAQADIFSSPGSGVKEVVEARRQYVTSLTRRRLHQSAFRERVLRAYQHQCAFCRLRHSELLDAAHIIPDSEPQGEPVISNGISLCRLHHAAFDKFFLGVSRITSSKSAGTCLRKSMGQPCDTPSKGCTDNPLYCRQDWRSGRLLHSYRRDTSDSWRRRWTAEVKGRCHLLASLDRAAAWVIKPP